MNFTAIKKWSLISQNLWNDYDMIQLQNQQFINNNLHKCLQMFYRVVGVLKNFANFTGKHLCQVKCERKNLTLSMQPAPSL